MILKRKKGETYAVTRPVIESNALTRFAKGTKHTGRRPLELKKDNAAVVEGRTMFPTQVRKVSDSVTLLKSGHNSSKVGKFVTKGRWKGFPIYTLSLEERKTCPRSCAEWRICVVPGTPVLTADLRWVPIETLKRGQQIVGFDEHGDPVHGHRKTRIATVEKLGSATRNCMRITTDKGVVECSVEHTWIAKKNRKGHGWFRADELGPGDLMQFLAPPWTADTTYDGGRLRGFVEGEGSLATRGYNGFAKSGVTWSQKRTPLRDEINAIARSKGFKVTVRDVVSGVNGTDMSLSEIAGGWREHLRFMGTIRPSRLMNKVSGLIADRQIDARGSIPAKVLKVEFIGRRKVITIKTSTSTFIANGFLSHNCYGNHMPYAHRYEHGPKLEKKLSVEVHQLAIKHVNFVIRLHILGDFYSIAYTELWNRMLMFYGGLNIFGYTARKTEEPIGAALDHMRAFHGERFSIRRSGGTERFSAHTIPGPLMKTKRHEIICPAQTGQSAVCGTCALCWSAPTKTILFTAH